jgi:hypothetical protein
MKISMNDSSSSVLSPPASTSSLKAHPTLLLVYNIAFLVGPIISLAKATIVTDQPIPWPQMVLFTGLLGAAGGAVHGLASLSWHTGRGTFDGIWTMFYIARPFVGTGMALITYLVLKSGLGGFNVESDLALLAWATLAGLYSQPALDKLRDIFATIFRAETRPDSTTSATNTAVAQSQSQPSSTGLTQAGKPNEDLVKGDLDQRV